MTQIVNKKKFNVEIDGAKREFAAVRPNISVATEATLIHSKAFADATRAGAMLRANLAKVMREQELWDDEKESEYQRVTTVLLDGELKLKRGGLKLKDAKNIAIDMRRARYQMQALSNDRNQLDAKTAEYFADNAKFNFLVSKCTVYADTGETYFSSYDDYQSRQDDPVVGPAAEALAAVIYGLQDDFESKLPENKFLLKFKFCDNKLHLVNKDGKLVDSLNRLVDDQDRLINEQGQLIDSEGIPLTQDGEYDVQTAPFLDDNGNDIAEESLDVAN